MPADAATVTVTIVGGQTMSVPWTPGMNAQQALEAAYQQQRPAGEFTYALQFFGQELGYLVVMINETFESFMASADPFYFWEFLLNGKASPKGVDGAVLNAGDKLSFEFQRFDHQSGSSSTLNAKYVARLRAKKA